MKIKYFFIALLLIAFANIYIFFNRQKFSFTKQISYTDLYEQISTLPVKEIVKINDSTLQFNRLQLNADSLEWKVKIDGVASANITAVNPIIHLQKGVHDYWFLSDIYPDSLTANIEYIPKKNSENNNYFVGVYTTNITDKNIDVIESDKNIFDNINANSVKEINNIVTDTLQLHTINNTAEKVEKVMGFLNKRIGNSVGNPTKATNALNAFEQYKAALNGQKIWCGNYAQIFNLFVKSAKIQCRQIYMYSRYKNTSGSGHVFNEYFLPEKKQWVAVDLMYNNIGYYYANGNLLNGVEVKNALYTDSTIIIKKAKDTSYFLKQFNKMPAEFHNLYGREKDMLFTFRSTEQLYNGTLLKKISNYAFPNFWYQYYSDKSVADNKTFYIKQFALFSLILMSITVLLLLAGNNFKNKQ